MRANLITVIIPTIPQEWKYNMSENKQAKKKNKSPAVPKTENVGKQNDSIIHPNDLKK